MKVEGRNDTDNIIICNEIENGPHGAIIDGDSEVGVMDGEYLIKIKQ